MRTLHFPSGDESFHKFDALLLPSFLSLLLSRVRKFDVTTERESERGKERDGAKRATSSVFEHVSPLSHWYTAIIPYWLRTGFFFFSFAGTDSWVSPPLGRPTEPSSLAHRPDLELLLRIRAKPSRRSGEGWGWGDDDRKSWLGCNGV